MHLSIVRASLLAVLMVFTAAPLPTSAQVEMDPGFDPNFILTDEDIFNPLGMTKDRMIRFLRDKGTLAELIVTDIDGVQKTAADVIWRVSQSYKINPKYLLVLLQKEQSLVQATNPTQRQLDWATGYAVCDSCSKDDPAIQNFKGFAPQVEWAAKQHREKYLIQLLTRGLTIGGQAPGKTVDIDGVPVTPANHATAMLYTYTPHIQGNLNLWRIWRRWFSMKYPEGTLVRGVPSGKMYLIRWGEKRPYASPVVASSMADTSKAIDASDTELQAYPDGPTIKFAVYSLLRDPNGRIYLITNDAKRHIATLDAFRKFGFNSDEVIQVTHEDLAAYPEGSKITVDTTFPQGTLVKAANEPGVWYVENGTRRALIDSVYLTLYFRGRKISTVATSTIESYDRGMPYMLHDGELVKTPDDPTVYVVENSILRAIPSEDVFESVGWRWGSIVTVRDSVLNLHQRGEPFNPDHTQLTGASL